MDALISVDRALEIIDQVPISPRIIRVDLTQAHGLALAQDIFADRDSPPFDKSLMDGYAVRSPDVSTAPVDLKIVGEVAAGSESTLEIKSGEAIAIMTGAALPKGADGVVPIEDCEKRSEQIRILNAGDFARFITRRGADCRAGKIVLGEGTRLEAAQLAVAASVGAAQVDVFAKPRTAVLSTGDELAQLDSKPAPHQIRNSNNIMLTALLRRLDCEVTDLGSAPDEPDKIRDAIKQNLSHDLLFVTGGMSMGKYDFVPKILEEIGVDLKVTKLRIKPGKPFIFGVRDSCFVFGLPGNPVSAFVCAARVASELIARMGGRRLRWIEAPLASNLPLNGSREFYQPAIFDGRQIEPLEWRGSADIFTLARANGLIVRKENSEKMNAGDRVKFLELPI